MLAEKAFLADFPTICPVPVKRNDGLLAGDTRKSQKDTKSIKSFF
jgi:hypothetical protein